MTENREVGGDAEIDFAMNLSGNIVPIEVKSGVTGKLKSLRQFLDTHPAKIGVKISEDKLQYENEILSIPFYLISQLPRLMNDLANN